jgi:hypothetical protein
VSKCVDAEEIVDPLLTLAPRFRLAAQTRLPGARVFAVALVQFLEDMLLMLAVLFLELVAIAGRAVDFDQPSIRVLRIQTWIDLVHLDRAGRELAELAQMELRFSLMVGVLAEQLSIGLQLGARLREERLRLRQRLVLRQARGGGQKSQARGGSPSGRRLRHHLSFRRYTHRTSHQGHRPSGSSLSLRDPRRISSTNGKIPRKRGDRASPEAR